MASKIIDFKAYMETRTTQSCSQQSISDASIHDIKDSCRAGIAERRSSGSKKVRSSFQMTISLMEKMDAFVTANSGFPTSRNALIEVAVEYYLKDSKVVGGVTDILGFPVVHGRQRL